ncbi:hypothetical protein [Arthrobacter sp. N1]|uniref:hypothetical protein n=1 Tax=Arthrobacter sp. N1 TaxID=619291 RepID=UPI003BAE9E59
MLEWSPRRGPSGQPGTWLARNVDKVTEALGEYENLLALSLDITDSAASTTTVEAAVGRFGSIDGISHALQLDEAEHSHLYDLIRAANVGAHPVRLSSTMDVLFR